MAGASPRRDSPLELGGLINSMFFPVGSQSDTRSCSGGFPEEMFVDLAEEERQKYTCNICLTIVRDARICPNEHLFCAGCVFTWSMTRVVGRATCPVCRSEGRYRASLPIDRFLSKRSVKCLEDTCTWTGLLREYRKHTNTAHPSAVESPPTTVTLPQIRGSPAGPLQASYSPRVSLNAQRSPRVDHNYAASRGQESLSQVNTRIRRSRERMDNLFQEVGQQLERRRDQIQELHQVRERRRLEQLQEVRDLDQRLGEVADDLSRMLSHMNSDAERYRGYINEGRAVTTSNTVMALTPRLYSLEQPARLLRRSGGNTNSDHVTSGTNQMPASPTRNEPTSQQGTAPDT